MKKSDVKEALSLITDMLAGIHVKLQELDNRLADIEAGEDLEDDVCECGQSHKQELADMIGHIVHIELKDSEAGPWFFVMCTGHSSLMLQELTRPDIGEKIGDPKWYSLNEIERITMEKTL